MGGGQSDGGHEEVHPDGFRDQLPRQEVHVVLATNRGAGLILLSVAVLLLLFVFLFIFLCFVRPSRETTTRMAVARRRIPTRTLLFALGHS